jgi:hypothetical protein
MRSALFWDVTQRRMIIRHRRFEDNLSVPFARVEQSKQKMGTMGYPEMSEGNYHSTLRKVPEERRSLLKD